MNIVDIHAHPLLDRLYRVRDLRDRCPAQSCLFGKRLGIDVLKKGQVGAIVSSIYPMWDFRRKSTFMDQCHDAIKLVESHLAQHHDNAVVVTKPNEMDCALAQGKIAFIHAVEGGHVLEGRLENMERLYDWGVRSLTLTHFLNNDIAASTFDPRRKLTKHNGLTPFGCEVVMLMNTLGMVIDLAHCSEKAFWQVMELTKYPVIVSHTGIRRFVPWEICLSDEQIKAVAQNGGLVGIILSALWLRRP
jgi:membrane dipeptidase